MSERVARRVLGQHRSTQRKVPRGRPDKETPTDDNRCRTGSPVRQRLSPDPRLGSREAGWAVNVKRVERIRRRERLKVPSRQP